MQILFVDDDPAILAGMQRMLRSKRNEWQITFAEGGERALEVLEETSFHVVVTDMRMPKVDGAQLLSHLYDQHPATVRIVLSGHTELSAALRSATLAHRFLSKPCEPPVLIEAIEQACTLERRLQNQELRQLVGKLSVLPSPSDVVVQLNEALATLDVSVDRVAEIVSGDVAISVKLLQLVNSSFFGLAQEVTSVRQAVAYLGTSLIRGLVAASEVFAFAGEVSPVPYRTLSLLHTHSMTVATRAQELAPAPLKQDAFVAGLVHDVGSIVLAAATPDVMASVMDEVERGERAVHEIEMELLGASHAEVGAYLLSLWGLPYPVVEAVAHHHDVPAVGSGGLQLTHLVTVADALSDAERPASVCSEGPTSALAEDFLEACGLRDQVLEIQRSTLR